MSFALLPGLTGRGANYTRDVRQTNIIQYNTYIVIKKKQHQGVFSHESLLPQTFYTGASNYLILFQRNRRSNGNSRVTSRDLPEVISRNMRNMMT